VAQDEAANAERIYALQLWAREYFREEKEKFSAKDAGIFTLQTRRSE
jgi:hypothetical protein